MDEEVGQGEEEIDTGFAKELVAETRLLLSMPEDKRREYVIGVINGLADAVKAISHHEGSIAEKLGMVNAFLNELDEKAAVLIPPLTYAVKREYQDAFRSFLTSLIRAV